MQITWNNVYRATKNKFIKPLNSGCDYNISKLEIENIQIYRETKNLLKQAHKTLINVDNNLKSNNLVDANVLLRSAFEYVLTAMMIEFDNEVYEEFTKLEKKYDKTRPYKLMDKFKNHMDEISKEAFASIDSNEKLSMLTDLYDKLCKFTHSSLIVTSIIEIKNGKELEIFRKLMYQNYYFVKILLFLCLKHFTHDENHYLDLTNIGFSYMFLIVDIGIKLKEYHVDFFKYNDLLYYDKNGDYFIKNQANGKKVNGAIKELTLEINNNQDKFSEELQNFLK